MTKIMCYNQCGHSKGNRSTRVNLKRYLLASMLSLSTQISFALVPNLLNDEKNSIEIFRTAADKVVFIHRLTTVVDPMHQILAVKEAGSGSGIVWDKKGHVLTNFHVIKGAEQFSISLHGKTYHATVIGFEPRKDIAVLKIQSPDLLNVLKDFKPLEAAPTAQLQVGQKALAIGNPFGFDHSLTVGVISAVGRQMPGVGGVTIHDMIQTDASINPGNSGGPLLDSSGRLIGMNTAIYSESGSSAGVGFAVPADEISRVVNQIIQHGRVKLAGIGIQPVPPSIAAHLGVINGILVADVLANTPAHAVGIRPTHRDAIGRLILGDVIVGIDGHPIKNYDELYHLLTKIDIGATVTVTIMRNHQAIDLKFKTIDIGAY